MTEGKSRPSVIDADLRLPEPGELVAQKFRIERLVGRGGMGAVFVAQHEILRQRVALKLILAEYALSPDALPRFLNEARALARIQGEHVAHVIDIGTLERGIPYMVLEYLEGADLNRLLDARGTFGVEEAIDCVLQSLEALARAHAVGVVHRDFKPSNVFLTRRADGTSLIKVLDFGVSKTVGPDGSELITESGVTLGTPPYASPEQLCDSKSVDGRADIWSVGVVLYELLSGSLPFEGESAAERIAATLEQSPTALSARLPGVDPGLERAVMRCLARSRDDRFDHVADLADALLPFAGPKGPALVDPIYRALGLDLPARPNGPAFAATLPAPARGWRSTRAAVALLLAAAFIAGFAIRAGRSAAERAADMRRLDRSLAALPSATPARSAPLEVEKLDPPGEPVALQALPAPRVDDSRAKGAAPGPRSAGPESKGPSAARQSPPSERTRTRPLDPSDVLGGRN
jgi:serine/threonine-protein kinase